MTTSSNSESMTTPGPALQDWAKTIRAFSHDLKSPLGALRISAEALQEMIPVLNQGFEKAREADLMDLTGVKLNKLEIARTTATTKIIQCVDLIMDRLVQVCHLIDEFTLNAPESYPPVSINQLIQHHLEKLTGATSQYPLATVVFKNDVRIQSPVQERVISALLYNLLDNALYAIQAKGIPGTLTLSMEKTASGIGIIRFHDTGVGMSDVNVSHVFDRYFALQEGQIQPGLGLSRHAIRHMGGELTCSSEKNVYTEMTLTLPLSE
jgi:two-component system CAI-1 autoinducer sensor kinase/phosphatase CqsS